MVEKLTPSRTVFNILNYTFMIILCVICLAPLWHVMMASISDPRALMAASGLLFKPVGEITMRGYELVLQNKQILGGYVNTIIYVVGTTLLGTTLTIIGGFVLSRKTKLQVPFILIIIFTMMFNGGLIPSYMVNRTLGIINNRWAILIPGVINAFYIIIMKSSFEQLPASYEESAKLDGASPMTVMFRILLPLVKATTAVVAMFIIVQQWNSWFPASIYLTKRRDLWPLQLIMREILVQNDTARILTASDAINKADMVSNLVKYCVTIVGTLPVLCVYPFAQKYFVKGVTLGGVKG